MLVSAIEADIGPCQAIRWAKHMLASDDGSWSLRLSALAGAWVREIDRRKHPIRWHLGYWFPHWLAGLSAVGLLGVQYGWSWLWLLFFLAAFLALPVPAYWRMQYELRAYTMELAVVTWQTGRCPLPRRQMVVAALSGQRHYWAWPFRKDIERRLGAAEDAIHSGDVLATRPFIEVYQIVMDAHASS